MSRSIKPITELHLGQHEKEIIAVLSGARTQTGLSVQIWTTDGPSGHDLIQLNFANQELASRFTKCSPGAQQVLAEQWLATAQLNPHVDENDIAVAWSRTGKVRFVRLTLSHQARVAGRKAHHTYLLGADLI